MINVLVACYNVYNVNYFILTMNACKVTLLLFH